MIGTVKSDVHAEVRWYVLNPDGVRRLSPMVRLQSQKKDGMTR